MVDRPRTLAGQGSAPSSSNSFTKTKLPLGLYATALWHESELPVPSRAELLNTSLVSGANAHPKPESGDAVGAAIADIDE